MDSLAHPGGNLTGVFGARDPVVKQLEIYRQILPEPQPLRLLTLVDPTDTAATPPLLAEARDAADQARDRAGRTRGIRRRRPRGRLPVARAGRRSTACSSCRPACGSTSPRRSSGSRRRRTFPSRPTASEWVDPQQNDHGALFSLGVDLAPVGTAAAPFVDSILKGAKPADLPAQEVPKVEFALSLKRAAELGITVPADVVTQADVVYP